MQAMVKICNLAASVEKDPRWKAIVAKDVKADGQFYYSVKTTGIYCRPSCAARLPKPENIQFHATCQEAEQAGFHPCKRCKPGQVHLFTSYAEKITAVCRFIEDADTMPKLNELAEQAGLSPYYFHRIFKSITGVTPKAYALAQRTQRIHKALDKSKTVTEAIFEAGFLSNGWFYESADKILGMKPSTYRTGGANTKIYYNIGACSLGFILIAMSERGVCAIFLGNDPEILTRDLKNKFPHANLLAGDQEFELLVARVIDFVEAPTAEFKLPLDIQGTIFQQRVWQVLRQIPVGSTLSYTEIAQRIGSPKSVRAVANACAKNVLAVAIPCHRVVRNDGSLSGYRWGVERKRILLKREKKKNKNSDC